MDLPLELVYKIISYVPYTDFRSVSKEWKGEIDYILGKSIKSIEKWYKMWKPRTDYFTIEGLVRYYIVYYPVEYFISYPELVVQKLGLSVSLLDVIPNRDIRKRSDVRDWILNMPISVNDLNYVGW